MIYKSTKEEVQAYFQNPALNNSKIKTLTNCDLSVFLTDNQEEEESTMPIHFRQGGAVDTLLTGSKEDFNNTYHITQIDKLPSDTIRNIMENTFSIFVSSVAQEIEGDEDLDLEQVVKAVQQEDIVEYLLTSCNKFEYFTNRKDDSRVASALKAGWEYFSGLVSAYGKTILSLADYENIKAIVSNLKNSPQTKMFFNEQIFENNPNLDIYYQKIIYFKHQGVDCKAMLDILIVDKTDPNKVKFHPIDIKTTFENAVNFPMRAKSLRYDLQAAWYKLAITYTPIALDLLKAKREYQITNFRFLVETTNSALRKKALCFVMDNPTLKIGMVGKPEIRHQQTKELIKPAILGVQQLFNIFKYHYDKGDFSTEKIIEDNPIAIPFGFDYNKFVYEWS